ncbi:MAG: hypothetical protein WDN24_02695 [Sphingomonas sp.]
MAPIIAAQGADHFRPVTDQQHYRNIYRFAPRRALGVFTLPRGRSSPAIQAVGARCLAARSGGSKLAFTSRGGASFAF